MGNYPEECSRINAVVKRFTVSIPHSNSYRELQTICTNAQRISDVLLIELRNPSRRFEKDQQHYATL